jgi:hypothetical protein
MRCLIFLSATALSGCGNVGAALARTIPDEYRWIGFVIAAMTFAVWSYAIWLQERRFRGEFWILIALFCLSVIVILIDVKKHAGIALIW